MGSISTARCGAKVPSVIPSSTIPARPLLRSATRTGRCISPWSTRTRPRPSAASNSTAGLRSSTSSVTPSNRSIGSFTKTLQGVGGALGGPLTAYTYDWNMLPIGQGAVAEGAGNLQGLSAACRTRRATNLDQVMHQVDARPTPRVIDGQSRNVGRRVMRPARLSLP